jgi:hypothetical protein
MGSCPRSMDRWVGGFASSAAGSARPLSGDARVAAGDGAAAQSVCGGVNLGCVGGARRRVRASTDRCWNPGAGGDGARLAAPRGRSAGGAAGVVCRCGGFAANRFSGWSTVSSCRGWPCWSRLPWSSSSPRPVTGRCRLGRDRGRCPREDPATWGSRTCHRMMAVLLSHEPVQFLCHRIRHLGGERIRRAPGCAAFGCGIAWHDARLFAGNHPDLDRRTLDEAPVFRETQPPVQLIRAAVDLKHVENQRLTFSRRPIKNGPNQPAT